MRYRINDVMMEKRENSEKNWVSKIIHQFNTGREEEEGEGDEEGDLGE